MKSLHLTSIVDDPVTLNFLFKVLSEVEPDTIYAGELNDCVPYIARIILSCYTTNKKVEFPQDVNPVEVDTMCKYLDKQTRRTLTELFESEAPKGHTESELDRAEIALKQYNSFPCDVAARSAREAHAQNVPLKSEFVCWALFLAILSKFKEVDVFTCTVETLFDFVDWKCFLNLCKVGFRALTPLERNEASKELMQLNPQSKPIEAAGITGMELALNKWDSLQQTVLIEPDSDSDSDLDETSTDDFDSDDSEMQSDGEEELDTIEDENQDDVLWSQLEIRRFFLQIDVELKKNEHDALEIERLEAIKGQVLKIVSGDLPMHHLNTLKESFDLICSQFDPQAERDAKEANVTNMRAHRKYLSQKHDDLFAHDADKGLRRLEDASLDEIALGATRTSRRDYVRSVLSKKRRQTMGKEGQMVIDPSDPDDGEQLILE
jgi:hypothetical protein